MNNKPNQIKPEKITGSDNITRYLIGHDQSMLAQMTHSMRGTRRILRNMLREGFGCQNNGYHYVETKVCGMPVVWFSERL